MPNLVRHLLIDLLNLLVTTERFGREGEDAELNSAGRVLNDYFEK